MGDKLPAMANTGQEELVPLALRRRKWTISNESAIFPGFIFSLFDPRIQTRP